MKANAPCTHASTQVLAPQSHMLAAATALSMYPTYLQLGIQHAVARVLALAAMLMVETHVIQLWKMNWHKCCMPSPAGPTGVHELPGTCSASDPGHMPSCSDSSSTCGTQVASRGSKHCAEVAASGSSAAQPHHQLRSAQPGQQEQPGQTKPPLCSGASSGSSGSSCKLQANELQMTQSQEREGLGQQVSRAAAAEAGVCQPDAGNNLGTSLLCRAAALAAKFRPGWVRRHWCRRAQVGGS